MTASASEELRPNDLTDIEMRLNRGEARLEDMRKLLTLAKEWDGLSPGDFSQECYEKGQDDGCAGGYDKGYEHGKAVGALEVLQSDELRDLLNAGKTVTGFRTIAAQPRKLWQILGTLEEWSQKKIEEAEVIEEAANEAAFLEGRA